MEIQKGQLICKKNGKPFTSGATEGIVSEIKLHTQEDYTAQYVFLEDGSFTPLSSVCDKVEMDNLLAVNYVGRKNRRKKLGKKLGRPVPTYESIIEFPLETNAFTQSHRRLKHFDAKGYECSCCGIKGVKFGVTLDCQFRTSELTQELKDFTEDFNSFCEIFKGEDENGTKKYPGIKIDVYTSDNQLMTIDHINPLSKGGTWNPQNLTPMCQSCNILKGDK